MSFTSLLTHSCSIARTANTTGIKSQFAPVASDVACLIQPMDPDAAQSVSLTFGKAYKGFYAAGTDIREGDKIIDHLGRTMKVKGIRRRDYGNKQHLEATLAEDQAN